MSKTYGEDEGGEYVLWRTQSGQINKKYISGPLEGEHQGYDPNTKRSFSTGYDRAWRYEDQDEDDDDGGSSGGSGCYIATAATTSSAPWMLPELEYLKDWRYSVLEKSDLGNKLSDYYRRDAWRLAEQLTHHPKLAKAIRVVFVVPGIKLAQARKQEVKNIWLYDTALYLLFVAGLVSGKFIEYLIRR